MGYSGRYQGGRSREEHGIESDDYLSAEVLAGHALMIDLQGMVRGAVRKYWLAQAFIESVAQDDIRQVTFVGDNLHRLRVDWQSGGTVWVNRGQSDWLVEGHTLPPYGFLAKNGRIESSIERVAGAVVERALGGNIRYVNGRGYRQRAPLLIHPRTARIEPAGDGPFRLVVQWDAEKPAPKDLSVFYHFSQSVPGRRRPIEFYGGGYPERPTSAWSGRVETGKEWTIHIPPSVPPGQYIVRVGLWDARGDGRRYRLLGEDDGTRRYRVGTLTISEDSHKKRVLSWTPYVSPEPRKRQWVNNKPTDFGWIRTDGALRAVFTPKRVDLIPLPDGRTFELRLRLALLPGRPSAVSRVEILDQSGNAIAPAAYRLESGELSLSVNPRQFGYRVWWR